MMLCISSLLNNRCFRYSKSVMSCHAFSLTISLIFFLISLGKTYVRMIYYEHLFFASMCIDV